LHVWLLADGRDRKRRLVARFRPAFAAEYMQARGSPVAPLSNCTNAAAASRGSGGGFCEKLLASTATMAPARLTKVSST
jgi:hypothetical protein